MASLTLKREAQYGMFRLLNIKIDEDKIISLKYAEEKVVDLPIGSHTLIATMSWTKSIPMSLILTENEHKYILIECLPLFQACIMAYVPPFVIFTLNELPEPTKAPEVPGKK